MKTLSTLLQNALEDYLVQLPAIKLTDIAEICNTQLSTVVWKAVREAEQRKAAVKKEPIINGVPQSKAYSFLKQVAERFLSKPVGEFIGGLTVMFRDANTYGYRFWYATSKDSSQNYFLRHSEKDMQPIIAYGFNRK